MKVDMLQLEEVTFTKAEDFIDALRLKNWTDNSDEWSSSWRFRGHGDSNWQLRPSAWRWDKDRSPSSTTDQIIINTINRSREMIDGLIEGHLKVGDIGQIGQTNKPYLSLLLHQAYAEHRLLEDFRVMMNELGLSPGTYGSAAKSAMQFVGDYIEALTKNQGTTHFWTGTSIAMAQHHGVPTRFLDWTKNPLAAAYFAAESAANSGNIAVIAVEKLRIERPRIASLLIHNVVDDYLHAQSGFFTIDQWAEYQYLFTGRFPSLEDKIDRKRGQRDEPHNAKKYLLPFTETREVLRLLWLEGVTRAHLMPTVDNIVATLKTR